MVSSLTFIKIRLLANSHMANRKTYHIVPTFDLLPPPKGPLALASILAAPNESSRPLDSLKHIEIPSERVTTITETDWRKTITSSTNAVAGVYATFLQLSGFGAELSLTREDTLEDVFAFESLTTTSFEPDDEFVANLIKASVPVQRYMEARWYGKRDPVYIVTGYKVVKGAHVRSMLSKSRGAAIKLGGDLTSLGVPVQLGPEVRLDHDRKEETEWNVDDEMLFAYRLREVRWKRKSVKTKAYNKGAFLDADQSDEDNEPVFEVESVATGDALDDDKSCMVDAVDEGSNDRVKVVFPAVK